MCLSSVCACESLLVTFCAFSWSFHRSGTLAASESSAMVALSLSTSMTASMLVRVVSRAFTAAASSRFTSGQPTRFRSWALADSDAIGGRTRLSRWGWGTFLGTAQPLLTPKSAGRTSLFG